LKAKKSGQKWGMLPTLPHYKGLYRVIFPKTQDLVGQVKSMSKKRLKFLEIKQLSFLDRRIVSSYLI